ncbi:MAG: metallophosphoesterase [Anaerolineales bacterium]|nr:metallophosphoesterase [Anaerolineales bacterium]
MQTLVIGDIHGCYDELQALLDKAGLTEGDAIVSVGDCVDRGPETPAVLDFFQKTPNAFLIMGNHERKHVRAGRHEVKLAQSQKISKIQFGETYPDALAFMDTLPLYLDLPEALVVHGYFEPGLALSQQRSTVLCGTMGGDKHLRAAYDRPWYELYDGEKPLLVGHHNYSGTDQPFVYRDRVFGLDTDCVTGRALTGLLLPSFKVISVPSRTNYWAEIQQRYSVEIGASPKQVVAVVAWNEGDEKALLHLIGKVEEKAKLIMLELHSEPGFDDLSVRKQAKRFSAKTGNGVYAALLHLARLSQLNNATARKVLKSPEVLSTLLRNLDE